MTLQIRSGGTEDDKNSSTSEEMYKVQKQCGLFQYLIVLAYSIQRISSYFIYFGFPFLFLPPSQILCTYSQTTPVVWQQCTQYQACARNTIAHRFEGLHNWYTQLNMLCDNQMFKIGIMGTMFLSGYLFQQLYLHNAAEAINRKYILIFANATISIILVILMNSEYSLQFALCLFSIAILFSVQDHIGLHMIFDQIPEGYQAPLNYVLQILKFSVLAINAALFGLYHFSATDLLYYLLLLQITCLIIHIVLPEEESSYTLFEDRLSQRLLNSTRSLIKQDDQLKFFKAHHIKVKKILKSIKNEYGRTREFIYVVFIYSIVAVCSTAVNFGLGHLLGSLNMNALVLSLADITALLSKSLLQLKVKEKDVYLFTAIVSTMVLTLSFMTIVVNLLDFSLVSNELVMALLLFNIKLGLNLQQYWILAQTEKFFNRKSHYYEVHSLSDTISKFACIIVPIISQYPSHYTIYALILVAQLLSAGVSFVNSSLATS